MATPTVPTTKPGQTPRPASATGTFSAKAMMNASGVFSSEQLSPDANSFPVIY